MGIRVFNELVENIKTLSNEEKEEIKFLIEKYLVEERRKEIYENYQKSVKELHKGKLVFSNDVTKLKKMIEQ